MTLEFDHAAICAETLEDGVAYVEKTLGVEMDAGGQHPLMGTHNRLLSIGPSSYLEVIAIDPELPGPPRKRWFGLDEFRGPPRLAGWIARTDDFLRTGQEEPFAGSPPMPLSRGTLRWEMLLPDLETFGFDGLSPAIIDWKDGKHPCAMLTDKGLRPQALTVGHPAMSRMVAGFPDLSSLKDVRLEVTASPVLTLDIETPAGVRRLT